MNLTFRKQAATFLFASLMLMGCSPSQGPANTSTQPNKVAEELPATAEKDDRFANDITEKYWKLIVLEGQPITMAENQERQIHFILKTDEGRITGFAGCNTFTGNYNLEKGNRIRFEKMAVTMMACPDVEVNESEFLQVFELADNYTVRKDTLSLNVGRRAPLAVFETVYF